MSEDIIDISQPLRNGIPPWPGDTEFSFELVQRKDAESPVNVGKFTASCHTGTHIDAPFHFDDEGKMAHELDLEFYVGPARVIEVSGVESVGEKELREHRFDGVSRLLIRTGSWTHRDVFPEKTTYLRPDSAPFLASRGVRLVGVDAPSVDPIESKELLAHHALHEHGVHILENVVLDGVVEGDYELICLPLALRGADGSPARAVLRPLR
ncbi:MAG: arylformamidase [Rubrobacteraceae bacterium]